MSSLWSFIAAHPKYAEAGLLERLVEPARDPVSRVLDRRRRADGDVNYVDGANITGFVKVADAMIAQGLY